MGIMLAEHAGFCFGVKRAVDMAEKLAAQGGGYTLGPIIHNPQVVADLERRGVRVLHDPRNAKPGDRVLIRSAGVPPEAYRILEERGAQVIDATCPDVAKIQRIAREESRKGKVILLMGDQNHPEVIGILGSCEGGHHCFGNSESLQKYLDSVENIGGFLCTLLAQTTFRHEDWQKCKEIIKSIYTNINYFDTICKATVQRQDAARVLAEKSDFMIVVGGRESSNTAKLAQICLELCPTCTVETAPELSGYDFGGAENIGITAGASTPAHTIWEVLQAMSDLITTQQDEMSFEEMLDQSFKTVRTHEKVTGVITKISPNEIAVDIGTKHAGYIPFHEFTDDPHAKLEELVNVGDEIPLVIIRLNDVEGTAMLSKKRLDAEAGLERVMAAAETGEILDGIVVDIIKGGIIVLSNGVRVFVPASQATMSRGEELEGLLRKPVQFKILEVNRGRKRAVGSIRAVMRDQRKELEEQFWQSAEVGKTYQGTVKSLTNYGAFVDLGGVDGMVHISELSWKRVRHPSEIVNPGDLIEVYIREIDTETKKISLGYKKTEDNPWEVLRRAHNVGDTAQVKIVSLTTFGAFAQIIPGIDGLIHISQISGERVDKPSDLLNVGDAVQAKITEIDYDRKRVSLSMRALLPEPEAAPAASQADGAVVAQAGPGETIISPEMEESIENAETQ